MSYSKILWLDRPAGNWDEALPLGNGRLGAMVFGGVTDERIQLNEDTLWSGEPHVSDQPEAWKALDHIRQLIAKRKYQEATEASKELQGPFTQSYLPFGDLFLKFNHAGSSTNYRRQLDLDTATVTVDYRINETTYSRKMYISAIDQALVIEIASSTPGALAFSASLTSPLRSKVDTTASNELTLHGKAPVHVEPEYRHVEPSIVYEENGGGMTFTGILKATSAGGTVYNRENTIIVEGANSARLFFTAATSFVAFDRSPSADGQDPLAAARHDLQAAVAREPEAVYVDHLAEYRQFYRRVTFSISDIAADAISSTSSLLASIQRGEAPGELVELYFQYGRYLLISSSRPGTQPANLQGIWNEDVRPAWSSNFTININTQMNYWPAETTNLSELSEPLYDLIDALTITGKKVAADYYGLPGWCAHHNTDIWALANPVGAHEGDPCWANWAFGGLWLTQHLWEHYRFTCDRAFLADRVLPVLKSATKFLLNYLVPWGGRTLVTCPSTSPENKFNYLDASGQVRQASVGAGCTMDLAIIREVFENTIAACSILDCDFDLAAVANDALNSLPPFGIGKEGELLEWLSDVEESDLGHRHISHLYANYPGMTITPQKAPELSHAVLRSLDRRVENGGGYTGWSRAWLINQYARLGEGEKAYDSIRRLLIDSTYPTLLDVHPPFQIDGNFGGTAGIAEMLLQSHDGAIHLLPALPSLWLKGSVTGLRARGAVEVSISWADGELKEALLHAIRTGSHRVRYGNNTIEVAIKRGETVILDNALKAVLE